MEMFGYFIIVLSSAWISSSQVVYKLHYSISEELEPRVIVGYVGQDSNLSLILPGPITYRFLGTYNDFGIETNSGVINTENKLDREVLCPYQTSCTEQLRVAAMSGSEVKTIDVSVDIVDVNDNSPTFPHTSLARSIAENLPLNTTIALVGATDIDMGQNHSVQSYEIVPDFKDVFALDIHPKLDGTSDLNLRTLRKLDRETRDYYQIFIRAKDGGSPVKTGMMMINITVEDLNDNKPTFTKNQYNVTINEDSPINRVFLTISATDADLGKNGEVHYKFSARQNDPTIFNLFNLTTVASPGGNYGELFVKTALTVIPDEPYKIIIEASDSGTSKVLSSQAIVNINILDINNNDPQIVLTFVKGTDDALVMENSVNGTVIAFVHVDDADQGINKIATCSINNNFFRLETFAENEFKISVNGMLDREDRFEHTITITCVDSGTPSRSATSSFIVQIEDENDNPPVFTKVIYTAEITENEATNTYVTKVSATDADQGVNSEVRYELGSMAVNHFFIDSNGIIKSKKVFDREDLSFYSFPVKAIDNGGSKSYTSTAMVEVTIKDENDNPPQFSQTHYRFYVMEEQIDVIGRVEANDPDALDNGVVEFYLPQQNIYLPFSVTNDGYLKVTEKLDREALEQYDFYITAYDHGLNQKSSNASVTVIVKDINDNAPVFKFPNSTNNTVNVPYLANPDTLVTTLKATDEDSGENGTLSYSLISGNDEDIFYMDGYSGEIFLKRQLHIYEIKIYELTVAAEDKGNPQQSTHELLWINIKFVNVTAVTNVEEQGAGQNIIIAIVIGCITVLLSVLIIITICVIRKMDAQKHVYSAKSAEHMRIVDLKRGSSNRSSSSRGSQDHMMSSYEMPNRKEVSFSMDDEQDNTLSVTLPSTLSSGAGLVTFKSNNSLNTQHTGHHRDESTDSGQQQLNRMTSLRVQQQYLQSKQNGRDRLKQSQQQQRPMSPAEKRISGHEDSDVSASSTTDSGNGGSDEDVRHHHPSKSDCRLGSVSPRQHSTADSAISSNFSAGKPSLSTFGYPQNMNSGTSTFPRNTQGKNPMFHNVRDPILHNNYNGAKLQRLHSDNIHPHQNQLFIDVPRVPIESQNSYHGDSNLLRANRNVNLTRSYDDTLSDSCVSPRDDDDRATTTSGSYTVNPEELCSEIDELFFRDRGDTVV